MAVVLAGLWLALAGSARAAANADLDQCRNGSPPPGVVCTGAAWQNGNLGATNSHYREGDSVPFRVVVTGITTPGAHTLDIEYDNTQGGVHAYDYLTTYDRTSPGADPCSGVAGCVLAPPTSTYPTPTDPNLALAAPPVSQVPGAITAWGATITDVQYLALPAGPEGTANQTQVRITFTATAATQVFAWGGHVASQADWGVGDAAGNISGSPYHMRLIALDGKGGNQDRSMKADAILPPPAITTATAATSIPVGGSVTDTATLSGPNGAVTGTVAFFVCGPAASAPSCAGGSGTQVGGAVTIAGGQATSAPFTPSAPGAYCFRAEYTPAPTAQYAPGAHTNLTTECVTVLAAAPPPTVDVRVLKTADNGAISAGDTAAFTMVVSNTGTGTATGVTLTDTLPAGVAWSISPAVTGCAITGGVLNCAFGPLGPGASVSVHVSGVTDAADCGLLTNVADVAAANEPPGLTGDNSSTATIAVGCPNVTVRKAADVGTISIGDTAGFTMVVSNTGAGTASGVTLTDTLPAGVAWSISPAVTGCAITGGVLNCAFGPLGPGASVSVHVSGATDAADCGLLANTATVAAANEAPPQTGDNSATATIAVNCAAIMFAKAPDAASVSAGDAIGFTITVTNPTAVPATNVTVTDVLPAAAGTSWTVDGGTGRAQCAIAGGTLGCVFGSLAGGAAATVHISSPTTAATCSTLDNVARVTTGNSGSAQAAAQVAVNCGSIQVVKAADAAAVAPGSPIGFTVTVRNTGAGLARDVALSDALPVRPGIAWSISPAVPGCQITADTLACAFGDLAVGQARTVHVSSPTTAASCGAYSNSARLTSSTTGATIFVAAAQTTVLCGPGAVISGPGGNPAPGGSPAPGGVKPAHGSRPRLAIRKTGPARAASRQSVSYLIRVTNLGTVTAVGVVVRDRIPAGFTLSGPSGGATLSAGSLTWRIGNLRAGASRTVRARLRIDGDTSGRRCDVGSASAGNADTVRATACTRIVRRSQPGAVLPAVTG